MASPKYSNCSHVTGVQDGPGREGRTAGQWQERRRGPRSPPSHCLPCCQGSHSSSLLVELKAGSGYKGITLYCLVCQTCRTLWQPTSQQSPRGIPGGGRDTYTVRVPWQWEESSAVPALESHWLTELMTVGAGRKDEWAAGSPQHPKRDAELARSTLFKWDAFSWQGLQAAQVQLSPLPVSCQAQRSFPAECKGLRPCRTWGPTLPPALESTASPPCTSHTAQAPRQKGILLISSWQTVLTGNSLLFCCLIAKLCPTLLWPHGLEPASLLCPWTVHRLNPQFLHLLHGQADYPPLSHLGSPKFLASV